MKECTWSCALVVLILGVASANASEFEGLYAGINAGSNKSTATALPEKSNGYGGVVEGYNWDIQRYLIGVNGFADIHGSSYTGDDAGVDVKFGLPMNEWLPYAKLGFVGTYPGARFHAGIGVEYKFAKRWSVNGEWMADSKSSGTTTYKNNNLLVGLNYYFGDSIDAAAAAGVADIEAAAAKVATAAAAAATAAYATVTKRGAKEDATKEDATKEDTAKEDAAKEYAAKEYADMERKKMSVIEKPVRLEGGSFAIASSKLRKSAGRKLDEVVNAAKQFPDIHLEVAGYTDDIGNAQSNLELSQARADAVKAYLVGKGVAAERISSKGFGVDNPVADNTTAEGRAKNRRVEIRYAVKEEQKVAVSP